MRKNYLIKNAKQILTMQGKQTGDIGILDNASLYMEDGIIVCMGSNQQVQEYLGCQPPDEYIIFDATGKTVLPGFIDCHTHVVFGGSRVLEYTASITGNREKLDKLGLKTGIYATIDMTNAMTVDELMQQSAVRVRRMIETGSTTIESKSGYTLNTEGELQMLRVNRKLERLLPVDMPSTFLGAHGWPRDKNKRDYMNQLIEEMMPQVQEHGLAEFCDVWCDEGYYTAEESEEILIAGLDYGMRPRIHTDAYSYIGGSDLAAQMGMSSADHLNYTPVSTLKKLSQRNVVGVILPAIEFAVAHPVPAKVRPMLAEGMMIALATNCCPGAWVDSMQFVLILACRQYGMTPEEALYGATAAGARALQMDDRGILAPGKKADLQIWDVDTYEDAFYKYTLNPVSHIFKNGELVVENGKLLETGK